MARGNRLFKGLSNRLLQMLEALEPGAVLGSELDLARRLEVSRTTVRAVLAHLAEKGILTWEGREKRLLRAPKPSDYFDEDETKALQAQAEEMFLAWVLQGDIPPRTVLNESDLARRFNLPLGAVREFLIRFEPFGLITKQPNRHWILNGFTRDFAEEMFEVRKIFEARALDRLLANKTLHAEFGGMILAHEAVVAGDEAAASAFPQLDAAFHALICRGGRNRFITGFSRTIAIIVHYHYLWNKQDEIRRNRAAAAEHLEIIRAVLAEDDVAARTALSTHLATAHRTLIASVRWAE